jgi:hypothetical protein
VTICMAAKSVHDECVVLVTDRQLSFSSDMPTAEDVRKNLKLGHRWTALYSGDGLGSLVPLIEDTKEILKSFSKQSDPESPKNIQRAICLAYQRERRLQIEDGVLSSYDISIKEFLRHGQALFGPTYEKMKQKIDEFDLGLSFLVAGPDSSGVQHIIEVLNPGVAKNRDLLGYWAIGSGASRALSSLIIHKQAPTLDTAEIVVRLCEAKFNAESAEQVGPRTAVMVVDRFGKQGNVGLADLQKIRSNWEDAGRGHSESQDIASIQKTLRSQGIKL